MQSGILITKNLIHMKRFNFGKMTVLLLFCFMQLVVFAQDRQITGKVVDTDGNAMPGVSVLIKGTNRGSVTDFDGNFSLNNVTSDAILVFSFVGYSTQEIAVREQTTIDVILREDIMELDEIVVMGYGTTKKSDVTGAMSSLKEDDFNRGVVTAPEQLIQGKIAGVQITSNGGEPGAGVNVRVRGANSIRSGTMPLYVVDGVPLDIDHSSPDGADVGAVNPASATNPLNFINPNDIQSIDILKDASAAAIYGARGANGVVIITTKKGKEGSASLNYSTYVGISQLRKKIDVLSAEEWVRFREDSLGTTEDNYGSSTDWQDEIFRTALSYSHSLSLSGGSKSTNYHASLNYLNQEGIVDKNDMNRLTGRINIGQKAINDKLFIDLNLTASQVNENRVPVGGTSGYQGDVILNALQANPTMPARTDSGIFQSPDRNVYSPVALLEYVKDDTRTNRILANLSGTLEIVKGLTYKINTGFDNASSVRRINASQRLNFLAPTGGMGAINNRELQNLLLEHTLNYTIDFETSTLSFLAGYSYQSFLVRGYNVITEGYETDEILYTYDLEGSTTNLTNPSAYGFKNELQSFFGRANYSLMDKYLVTATYRVDGSSKFGKNNKYGHFPSVALAWRISQEQFMQNLSLVNNLKLRLGWGITGNQEIPGKNSLFTLGSSNDAIALLDGTGLTQGYVLQRTPNEDIKWESSEQYNAGLDFGIFKGRLSGTIDFFYKETRDMLLEVTPYQPSPSSRQLVNIDGRIINKGIELGLTGFLIASKDIEWSLTGNYTKINNVVKDLPVTYIETGRASGRGYTDARVQVIMNGQPINVFYGYKYIGYDSRGFDAFETDTAGIRVDKVLGSPHPDFTYNISSNFRYKRVDVAINFEGVYGNMIFNNTGNIIGRKANLGQTLNVTPDAIGTAESLANPNTFSSKWLEDGSYFRLSNLTIGYTLKINKVDWLQNIRVYATGSNLFLLTKYSGFDPDVNTDASYESIQSMGIDYTNYPKARTYMVGLSANF